MRKSAHLWMTPFSKLGGEFQQAGSDHMWIILPILGHGCDVTGYLKLLCHDLHTLRVYNLELWAKINPIFPFCVKILGFCYSNRKKTSANVHTVLWLHYFFSLPSPIPFLPFFPPSFILLYDVMYLPAALFLCYLYEVSWSPILPSDLCLLVYYPSLCRVYSSSDNCYEYMNNRPMSCHRMALHGLPPYGSLWV